MTQMSPEAETLGSEEPQFLQNAVPYLGCASRTNRLTDSSPRTHSSPSRVVKMFAACALPVNLRQREQ